MSPRLLVDDDGGRGASVAESISAFVLESVEPGQLVHLTGRLDVHAAADVRLALADAVQAGSGDLVIDLASLDAVDATGLGVLVGAHRRAGRAGRTLVLRDVPPPVGRLLFLTRLDRVLHISSSAA
jgi:anti-anti-sigma factor